MTNFKKVFHQILDLFYPTEVTCFYCGQELKNKSKCGLCDNCYDRVGFLSTVTSEYVFGKTYSCCAYDDIVRSIIIDAKDDEKPYLARIQADFIAREYKKLNLDCDVIAYVPSSKRSKRKRGYDNMKNVAEFLSISLDLPVIKGLKRVIENVDQTKLTREQRYGNVENNFTYVGEKLDGKKVLLIDDVVTTGATLNACATALAFAKPLSVACFTFARAESATNGADKN